MKKRLKHHKKYDLSFIFSILFIFILGYVIYFLTINIKYVSNNESLIDFILNDTNKYINEVDNINLSSIINTIFFVEEPFRVIEANIYKEEQNFVFEESKKPRVYIYSTHDEEGYLSDYKEGYDLSPNIIAASHLLKEELNKRGILTIVENERVSEDVKKNNMKFYESYQISRKYVINELKEYPDLELIIDLHRDALARNNTYIEYNGQNYAKVLFVVGQKYSTYQKNLELSKKIDSAIKKQISNVSKGIMMKNEAIQNGIYNQDLNPNIILLELGSNNNTVDEIYNSIIIVANAIEEVLNENKG